MANYKERHGYEIICCRSGIRKYGHDAYHKMTKVYLLARYNAKRLNYVHTCFCYRGIREGLPHYKKNDLSWGAS